MQAPDRQKKKITLRQILFAALILCLAALATAWAFTPQAPAQIALSVIGDEYRSEEYSAYLETHSYNGIVSDAVIEISPETAQSNDGGILSSGGGIVDTGDRGCVSWSFICPEDGFYNLCIEYLPLPGTNAQIERRLYIDGEMPYKGLEQVVLTRLYDNTNSQDIRVKYGSEVRPLSSEVFEYNSIYVSDALKRSREPYLFYLSKGTHTLTLDAVKEPCRFRKIAFEKAPVPAAYKQASESYSGIKKYSGQPLVYQAERIGSGVSRVLKTAQAMRNYTDYSNPDTVPFHPYRTMFNTFGGNTWRAPGEILTWEVDVREAGLYSISFRAKQNVNRGVTSFRRLMINGEVPYKEADALGFEFTSDFSEYRFLIDGNEALIPLKAGINRISLEVVIGDFASPLSTVERSLAKLNDLYRRTVQITGLVPDRYIDYEIEKKIPDFSAIAKEQSDALFEVVETLTAIAGEKGENTALVDVVAYQALVLSGEPERVVRELDTFKNNISSLGTWIIQISEMPLELDSFTLYAPDTEYMPRQSNGFIRLYYGIVRFLATFFIDESRLSDEEEPLDALTVWVPTGRDQAQLIKGLADDIFYPQTGIPVEVQLIPLDVVLPATLSGSGPDMVVDMPQINVMNFAMRNALVDLRTMEGFDELASRFYPSALQSVTYLDGVYGMPEQQWFYMMYCRDDILNEIGITPPKTWDEFEQAIMLLNIYNYDVYIPEHRIYSSLVFQYGGDMYIGEGTDYGIASGLYSDAAMLAFQKMTGFFTGYKLPVRVDFPNRFRTGEMPLGISEYILYNTFELFAPEIRGLWSFHPIPGVPQADGSIKNTSSSTSNHSVILKNAGNIDNAWTFLQWWLSPETQTDYAAQLEAILGTAGRYATANTDVLMQLPWTREASDQLLAQFPNTVGIPEVPGGYMTERMVDYAYRAVVTGSSAMSPRQALYLNIMDIDKELTKKRIEFGLSIMDLD